MNDKNPFDYFDKIFCINLDSRPDRWEQVQKEFDKVGILDRVERFSALTGKTEGGPQGKNVRGWLKWKNVDGNNLSNLSCIKYAKENNLNNVLIFEDDIYFRWWDKQRFQKIIDTLSEQQWRLFFFGGTIDRRPYNPPFHKISDELYNIHLPLFGTSSYAVNSCTYDAILNNRFFKVDWSIPDVVKHHRRIWNLDVLLGRKFDGKYTMREPMCLQIADYSEVSDGETDHHATAVERYKELFGR